MGNHIYNRGTDKRDIFLNEADYLRFLVLLYICNNTRPVKLADLLSQGQSLWEIFSVEREDTLVDIGVYCLMKNHFHLLIKEKKDNGITIFMKKLGTAYSMYFNKIYDRSGNLFQGRFQAELADKDEYLKYLFAYIHLNPVKIIDPRWKEIGIKNFEKSKKFLEKYPWSSYQKYLGEKQKDPILNKDEFPRYFDDFDEFESFIDEWLDYSTEK